MERIACIHFPQWPIQRLVVARPELRCQRIVLMQQHPQRGQLVAAASPLALRSGVRIHMPVTEAKSLLRKTGTGPDSTFHCLPYEPAVDHAALTELARELDSFSPIVGIDPQEPSSRLLLDLTGLAPLFGGEETLLKALLDHLRQLGYAPEAAVAPTLGAAWALARTHATRSLSQKESGSNPTSAQMIALSPFDWKLLDDLPPSALRLEPATNETLRQLGLTTIGSVRQIPAESLASRFGDQITRRLHQCSGQQVETFRAVPRSTSFQAEQVLDFPLRDQTTVLIAIERLLMQICSELKQIRHGALVWHIRLQRQNTSPLHLRVGLFQASARADQVMPLVRMQLEQDRSFDGVNFPIEEIAVSAGGCVLLVEHQGQLFDEQPRKNEAALGGLLNRLAIRLGEDNVVSAAVASGAQPERAVEYRPLVGPRSVRPRRSTKIMTSDTMTRPLRLLLEPLELNAMHAEPSSHHSNDQSCLTLPQAFQHQDGSLAVRRSWGPERIETGWWHGRTVRRDYWRIETETGALFWIYRDLRSLRWYLHGAF